MVHCAFRHALISLKFAEQMEAVKPMSPGCEEATNDIYRCRWWYRASEVVVLRRSWTDLFMESSEYV